MRKYRKFNLVRRGSDSFAEENLSEIFHGRRRFIRDAEIETKQNNGEKDENGFETG